MTSTTIILVLFLTFAVFLIISGYRGRQKRLQSLQSFASQNGWEFVPGAGVDYFPNASSYELFNPLKGYSKQITALIKKPHAGGEAFVFDYSYKVHTSGHGSGQREHTVVAFRSPRLQLPYFALYPESFFSGLGELFGYNDIDFESHPKFSERFKLCGKDVGQVRQLFRPQVRDFFEGIDTINVDGGGDCLFLYTSNTVIPAEQLNGFVNHARQLYDLFRG
jgi:hypothetical protein